MGSDARPWVAEVRAGGHWKPVRPSGGEPYTYETAEDAQGALRLCYPDQLRIDRLDGTMRHTRVRNLETEVVERGF